MELWASPAGALHETALRSGQLIVSAAQKVKN
jgi:hypothetical protein